MMDLWDITVSALLLFCLGFLDGLAEDQDSRRMRLILMLLPFCFIPALTTSQQVATHWMSAPNVQGALFAAVILAVALLVPLFMGIAVGSWLMRLIASRE